MTAGSVKIPYAGFRLVFTLINAALWLALAFGITSAVSIKMEAVARFDRSFFPAGAAAAAGLVGLYGGSGALAGFLDMARSGRIALPPRATWGAASRLDAVWSRAAATGLIMAAIAGAAAWASGIEPARGRACWLVAVVASALAAMQAAYVSGPRSLADLARDDAKPCSSDARYIALRIALPQAAGNGIVTALVAAGSYSPADMIVPALASDAAATALVIGVFMLVSSASVAATDRGLGRVRPIEGRKPSIVARIGWLIVAAIISAAVAAMIGAVVPTLPLVAYVAWKGLLGAAAAAALSSVAARAALSL